MPIYSVQFALIFSDATSRRISFNDVSEESLNFVKRKLVALNDDMPEAFSKTFVSNNGASCIGIKDAKIIGKEEVEIYNANS